LVALVLCIGNIRRDLWSLAPQRAGREQYKMNSDEQAHTLAAMRSLARTRWILLSIAVVIPVTVYWVGERQARRLGELGAHGQIATATITQASSQAVYYAYQVNGVEFTWNVSPEKLPSVAVGATVPIVFSPADPALSRPGADRTVALAEATSNRTFMRNFAGGIFVFFGCFALMSNVSLLRIRKTGHTERTDPKAYKTRLLMSGGMLAAMVGGIGSWHWTDAMRQGESVLPVVLGVGLVAVILGSIGFYAFRGGSVRPWDRMGRVLRWVAPLAIAIAVLRAIVALISSR
jgi:hypothetical protein